MAYIWEILRLFNNYSFATPPHNSVIIQAFQQAIEHTIQWLIREYYTLCYVLLLSFCSAWFQSSSSPSHVKPPPDPLQNPACFSSYLHNIQVFIQPYSWTFAHCYSKRPPQPIMTSCHVISWDSWLAIYHLFHTYSVLIPYLFSQRNTKKWPHPIPHLFHQRKHKEMTHPIPHLFHQRKHKETTIKKTQRNDFSASSFSSDYFYDSSDN